MNKKGSFVFNYCREFLENYLPLVKSRSIQTITAYVDALTLFRLFAGTKGKSIDDFYFSDISEDFMLDFRIWLAAERKQKPQSVNHRFMLVRNYIRYCSKDDLLVASLWLKLKEIPGLRCSIPDEEALTEEQITLLLHQPVDSKKGIRNRTFMIMLYETAARVSELINLRIENIFLDTEIPHVILIGKGNKERSIPLRKNTCNHLMLYLMIYHPAGTSVPWLFYNTVKGNTTTLSLDCVGEFLNKYASMAHAVEPDFPSRIHSHLFRRSKATHLSDHGIGLPIISRYLGHADITTTMTYVKPNQKKIKEALEKSSFDYQFTSSEAKEYENIRAKLCRIR